MLRAAAPWRRLLPNRTVRRQVQGVELFLPWSHLLPDYARAAPAYGQNLVRLAEALEAERDADRGPLRMLDVGANIGDSTAQVIARTGAEVLCVEGDPYWARYLRMNLGDEPRATIVEALLTGTDGEWDAAAPVRMGGTTRFVQDADQGGAFPAVTISDLRAQHPRFDDLRLVKSDTDGFDAVLVPAIAAVWRDVSPVLFFEWDPALTRKADPRDPDLIWAKLADLGYSDLAIWDNGGAPLGQLPIGEAAAHAQTLGRGSADLGYTFWDVAARRADDAEAARAFDSLVPASFSVTGHPG
jgi:FkbM family methyltransferase